MFGRLSLDAIPSDPIIQMADLFMILVGLAIVGAITYYRKWGWLYKEWLTTVDHKKIGIMYWILGFIFLVRGFVDAIMMRAQQAMAGPGSTGYLDADHFAELFTGHGTMMIIFVAMPMIVGLFNIVVPLQIGARDVAYPYLNSLSWWLTCFGGVLVMLSLMIGQFSTAGWTGYPPFSEMAANPSSGVDYWIWALQLSGMGTTLVSVNFIVTILRERAPGMSLWQMPLFTWTVLVTSFLIMAAFPTLTAALGMLSLDRMFDFHFFTGDMGGNQMLFLNIFWLWGHPEVYVVALPAYGVFSEITAAFSNKRLYGYTVMVVATAAVGILSMSVWVHHFFTMGQDPLRNSAFSIATMVISVPTGVKVYNWLATMYRGRIEFTTPMLWTISFLIIFTIGGITGVMLSIPGLDFQVHNTTFLVAHFHNVLIGGTVFAMFAGYTYWFPKMFGFRLDERWGRHAFWGWSIGFLVAFMPLYVLGAMGMPRRMFTYNNPEWQPWLIIASIGALIILYAIVCQGIQLVVSIKNRDKLADLTGDPWGAGTLEWMLPSPPPAYNFAVMPEITDREPFMAMKENGTAYQRPEKYDDIHMPNNTITGFVVGVGSFVFGFGAIWHIWWLAIVGLLIMIGAVISRSFIDHPEHTIPAAEVKRVEDERFHELKLASQRTDVIDTGCRRRVSYDGEGVTP